MWNAQYQAVTVQEECIDMTLPKAMFYYVYTCEDERTIGLANNRLRN